MRKIKKILVTGAGGYMGGYFIAEAAKRFKSASITASDLIDASARLKKTGGGKNIGFIKCDVADLKAAKALVKRVRPDVIINLAGTGAATILPWDVLIRANLSSAVSVMEAALSVKPSPTVILVGSAAEYGAARKSQLPVRENAKLSPVSPYGLVKSWQSEAADFYAARGLDVIVARMFNVLGPAMSEALSVGSFAAQISRIKSGGTPDRALKVGDIGVKRDFVDVRDVAEALCLLALEGKAGFYNVSSGKSVSLKKIIKILCGRDGTKIKIVRQKSRLRTNDVRDIRGSCLAIRKQTGWKPRRTLAETLDSIRTR
jgi:GDP-4-dehydro-6-deoxy-D-mannose reductase